MSRIITLEDEFTGIGVFYAADEDIVDAGKQARELIQRPEYPTVVVLRPGTNLQDSWRTAAQNPELRKAQTIDPFIITPDNLYERAFDPRNGEYKYAVTDENRLETLCGHDFKIFAKFCQQLGPSKPNLTALDANNKSAHLDG